VPLPRPPPHERGPVDRGRSPPEGDPDSDGASSITITLDRYGHLFPELDEAIADEFGRQFDAAQRRLANNVIPLPL
jgi:hypothetical protein